jgi:lipopolysaccharide assembly protein A
MKGQSFFILGLIFALIIAVLAVINNDPVQFNYVFGSQKWPLILIILTTAVFGGVVAASLSFVKIVQLRGQVKQKNKRIAELEEEIKQHKPVEPVEPVVEEGPNQPATRTERAQL